MSVRPAALERLIEALRCLPGVGPKTAQRMAFHLIERDKEGARLLARTITDAVERVGHCSRCRALCEASLCEICLDSRRERALLCVVETPADLLMVERATGYRGLYFVLMGHLSPLDGIGPAELGLNQLEQRLREGEIREVILATNPTVEGEATSHYIGEMAREAGVKATRIAHGIPVGGELEFVDTETLSYAFVGRRDL